MTLEDIAREGSTITGAVTGRPRVLDDASLLFMVIYAHAIEQGETGVTCPECLTPVTHNSAIDDVPTGKRDIYGNDEYVAGFHCRICEYTTPEWPSERS